MDTRRHRLFAPVSAGALALGLAIGLALPLALPWLRPAPADTEVPDSFVGVLAAPEGGTGLVVSVLRRDRTLDTRLPEPLAMPAGRTLFLWAVEVSGATRPIGPVPASASGRITLSERADAALAGVVAFGVTVERAGDRPDRPVGAFVYRGACNRLWRSPAPTG